MRIGLPELSLVVLIGPSGAGKSTFAARHFRPTEVVSSDECRALVSDDPNDQAATAAAFEVLHVIAEKRLAAGRLTVVDATNVQREARRPLLELARRSHVLPTAIVLDVAERTCVERNAARPDRPFGARVVRRQRADLKRSLRGLEREGFRRVFVLRDPEEIQTAEIVREPAWSDRRSEHGPFDVIGDVHGCFDELVELLRTLGYEVADDLRSAAHPDGRTAVFLGDLVDRGPATPAVLRLVMGMAAAGSAWAVPGNHESRLVRALRGRDVARTHGLAGSLEQLDAEPPEFRRDVVAFLDGLVSHLVFDDGRLVVAHAGMREEMQMRASAAVRSFALYGETTGEIDEFGLPVRYPWANEYRGSATVVYGHTPIPEPEWVNGTIDIDTGCVFGGRLTALRYPERELVSVPAARVYHEPVRPLVVPELGESEVDHRDGDGLSIDDVLGKRIVDTRLQPAITIRDENARAALEVMSRFAIDPRWLIYLPPTMAPTATSPGREVLEHPAEALASFRKEGVERVVCEEKHMGSRAMAIVGRDDGVGARRFGIDGVGVVHTRTGRRFFEDVELETAFLARLRSAIAAAGLWDELGTDWLALDGELLPWSAKARELILEQYAPVAASGAASLGAGISALEAAAARGLDVASLLERTAERRASIERFAEVYARYCWDVAGVDDLRFAPFQVLASEGRTFVEEERPWHLGVADRLSGADGLVLPTRSIVVEVEGGEQRATDWWQELTEGGGEGIVVKPLRAVARGRRGLAQPGLKVRGREYLRLVYGPEYTAPENLSRLRERSLGHKRSLAVREFALGVEALERFVRREPLYRVHECVFGVLALESEPVDPTF